MRYYPIFSLKQLDSNTDKYLMKTYPSVWPLPFGVTIQDEYQPEHNYALPRSQTHCWTVNLVDFQQVKIVAVHNGIIGNQQNTIKAWLSIDPNGSSILPVVYGTLCNIHLGLIGNSWCYYTPGLDPSLVAEAEVQYVIDPTLTYYFNLQNLENKDNSYYLKFTFMKDGDTIEL